MAITLQQLPAIPSGLPSAGDFDRAEDKQLYISGGMPVRIAILSYDGSGATATVTLDIDFEFRAGMVWDKNANVWSSAIDCKPNAAASNAIDLTGLKNDATADTLILFAWGPMINGALI